MLNKFTFDVHSFKKQILFLILLIKSNTSISYNNVYPKKKCIIPIPNVLLLNHCVLLSSFHTHSLFQYPSYRILPTPTLPTLLLPRPIHLPPPPHSYLALAWKYNAETLTHWPHPWVLLAAVIIPTTSLSLATPISGSH